MHATDEMIQEERSNPRLRHTLVERASGIKVGLVDEGTGAVGPGEGVVLRGSPVCGRNPIWSTEPDLSCDWEPIEGVV